MLVVSPFDEKTLEKVKACTRAGFPICLDRGLNIMFGTRGKLTLDSIVMNETFEYPEIISPKDIWKLYERYIERTANLLGDDVAQVIEFESLIEMRSEVVQSVRCIEWNLKNGSLLI